MKAVTKRKGSVEHSTLQRASKSHRPEQSRRESAPGWPIRQYISQVIMDLPYYRIPILYQVAEVGVDRTKSN